MRFFLVWLLFLNYLLAENVDANIASQAQATIQDTKNLPKVVYLSYSKVPKRVLKGEIFTIEIKALSTVYNFTDIIYDLSNSKGLKQLSFYPTRDFDDKYYYETFHFLVTEDTARLPDITATVLNYNEDIFKKTTLYGSKLNVVELNPKKDFANILANSFALIDYKTTNYDQKHNIIVFTASATNANIASFKLQNVFKQGKESISESYFNSKITYYAVIPNHIETFSFSYFNLQTNRFILINIPIIVNDDSVTTQSDLKPKDQSKEILKMKAAAGVALVGFIIILWRRKYVYLILIIIPLSYIVYIGTPSQEVCIKRGTDIQLLPVENGTIFETTKVEYHLEKEGQTKNWIKIKLQNNKIGWIKNEDICSY